MTDLLVTGGAGFVGANFVRYWRRRHAADSITVLDALTYSGNKRNLDGVSGIEFVHGDIGNFDLVLSLLRARDISTLVHFAAESHVDRSIHGPDIFVSTNIVGTYTLLKAAQAAWLDRGTGRPHRFHHISTDEVFGSLAPDAPGFDETTCYRPNSPYSATKAASDHLVRAYHQTYGLQVTSSNCSNNYGPYQFPEKLIPLFITNALLGKRLPIYGDGAHRRDWLHVEDHCAGISLILEKGRVGETYNIGGGKELPNLLVADRVCAAMDNAFARQPALKARFPNAPPARGASCASLKEFVVDRKGHDRRYAMDDSKARAEIDYMPTLDFPVGLESTIAWYLEHEGWWQPLRNELGEHKTAP
jgi:dTDP-glucose 4,6-dehydratase